MRYKALLSIFFVWLALMALISSLVVGPDPENKSEPLAKKIESMLK